MIDEAALASAIERVEANCLKMDTHSAQYGTPVNPTIRPEDAALLIAAARERDGLRSKLQKERVQHTSALDGYAKLAAEVIELRTALESQRQATEEAMRRAEEARRELADERTELAAEIVVRQNLQRELGLLREQLEARKHLAQLQAEA